MKITNIIQHVARNHTDASKHHLAAISEIIDKKSKTVPITSIVEDINEHLLELAKVPGKELVNSPKYNGTYREVYLVTQDELESIAHMFNKISELVPVHHTDSLAPMLSNIQCMINEIKKD